MKFIKKSFLLALVFVLFPFFSLSGENEPLTSTFKPQPHNNSSNSVRKLASAENPKVSLAVVFDPETKKAKCVQEVANSPHFVPRHMEVAKALPTNINLNSLSRCDKTTQAWLAQNSPKMIKKDPEKVAAVGVMARGAMSSGEILGRVGAGLISCGAFFSAGAMAMKEQTLLDPDIGIAATIGFISSIPVVGNDGSKLKRSDEGIFRHSQAQMVEYQTRIENLEERKRVETERLSKVSKEDIIKKKKQIEVINEYIKSATRSIESAIDLAEIRQNISRGKINILVAERDQLKELPVSTKVSQKDIIENGKKIKRINQDIENLTSSMESKSKFAEHRINTLREKIKNSVAKRNQLIKEIQWLRGELPVSRFEESSPAHKIKSNLRKIEEDLKNARSKLNLYTNRNQETIRLYRERTQAGRYDYDERKGWKRAGVTMTLCAGAGGLVGYVGL